MTHSINGHGCTSLEVKEPLEGVWVAEVTADTAADITGSVTIDIDGETWVGTVHRGGVESGVWKGLVAGGTCGLRNTIDAKAYVNAPLSLVLSDLAADCGETLASDVADLTGTIVPRWHRSKDKASYALRLLTDRVGVNWRILRDGTLWLGEETNPEVKPGDELGQDPSEGATIYGPTTPIIKPGQSIEGRQVSHVTTRANGGGVTQLVRFSGTSGGFDDRMRTAIEAIVEARVGRKMRYLAMYPCAVASQAADGTLEVIPDDDIIKGSGLGSIPIRHGQPGYETTVPAGARCLIGFMAGDPSRPYVAQWLDGTAVTSITFDGGTKSIARVDDTVSHGDWTALASLSTGVVTFTNVSSGSSGASLDLKFGTITTGNDKLKA